MLIYNLSREKEKLSNLWNFFACNAIVRVFLYKGKAKLQLITISIKSQGLALLLLLPSSLSKQNVVWSKSFSFFLFGAENKEKRMEGKIEFPFFLLFYVWQLTFAMHESLYSDKLAPEEEESRLHPSIHSFFLSPPFNQIR